MALADLVRVPIPYVLEIYADKGTVPSYVTTLPLGPATLQRRRPPPVALQRTFGRLPIRQHSVPSQWLLTLTGRSGLKARPGYDRSGKVTTATGPEILVEFDRWLRFYSRLAAVEGAHYIQQPDDYADHLQNVRMVFRAFDEQEHLLVEPVDWVWQRNKDSSRFSFEWTLVLEGYAQVDQVTPPNLLGPVAEWAKKAASAVDSAGAAVAAAQNVLKNARKGMDVLRLPAQRLQGILDVAAGFGDLAVSVLDLPRDVLADIVVATASVKASFDALLDQGLLPGEDTPTGRDVAAAFANAEDASRAAAEAFGGLRGGPGDLAAATAAKDDAGGLTPPVTLPQSAQQQQTIVYKLAPGDTLKSIAGKLLGDSALWPQIAYLNGLPDPYSSSFGKPLQPGDVILVPGGAATGAEAFTPSVEALYGVDLFLGPDGDVVIDGSGSDLQTVQGLDNLQQAIMLRLTTVQGTSGFANFGLPVTPGQSTYAGMAGYVATHAREQLLQDPRVADVTKIEVLDEGDTLSVRARVEPVKAGAFNVTAPFPSQA